jgi:peroxiredoxin family protein
MFESDMTVQNRVSELETELARLRAEVKANKTDQGVALICFSGEWDRLYAALTIANGALAMGQQAHVFFTFWAAAVLGKERGGGAADRTWEQKMLQWMLPSKLIKAPLSRMNFGGLGRRAMSSVLKKKEVDGLEDMLAQAHDLGARLYCCDMSLKLLGLDEVRIAEGLGMERCGVATFLSLALRCRMSLFI